MILGAQRGGTQAHILTYLWNSAVWKVALGTLFDDCRRSHCRTQLLSWCVNLGGLNNVCLPPQIPGGWKAMTKVSTVASFITFFSLAVLCFHLVTSL